MNQLKDAEKKASQLVSDARKARVDRLKDAKSEAEQAIASYRAEMEAEHQKNSFTHSFSNDSSGYELDNNTSGDIANVAGQFNRNKAAVETMLVDHVTNVHVIAPKARDH